MGVLVKFDAEGRWRDTWVCDALITRTLKIAGIGWGRWIPRNWPGDPGAQVLQALGEEPGVLGNRFQPQRVERLRLEPEAPQWAELRPRLGAEQSNARAELRIVTRGTGLTYIRAGDGFLALLGEADEWVLLPAFARHWFDAGEVPELDMLRLWGGSMDVLPALPEPAGRPPHALPSFDAFVAAMLELTGHEED